MPTQVKTPQIFLPTGYESLQLQAEQKHRLAQRLLDSSYGQQAPMSSYTQLLGQLAEAFVGRRAEKKADALDLDIKTRMGEDYRNKSKTFYTDAQVMRPDELIAKWSTDPMMADLLDPYKDAYAQGLKEKEGHTTFGGQWMRKGDIKEGAFDNKPTDRVIGVNGPNGPTWQINPTAITANIASLGTEVKDPVMSMPAPGVSTTPGLTSMPQGAPPAQPQEDSGALLTPEAWTGAVNALGSTAAADWIRRNPSIKIKVNSPADVQRLGLPSGTRIITPNGDELEVP